MRAEAAVSGEVQALVDRIVREQLRPANVERVRVVAETTWDDEAILRVDVVVAPVQGRLDPARVVGLAQRLSDPLAGKGEDRSVVFRFLTPEDARREAA